MKTNPIPLSMIVLCISLHTAVTTCGLDDTIIYWSKIALFVILGIVQVLLLLIYALEQRELRRLDKDKKA